MPWIKLEATVHYLHLSPALMLWTMPEKIRNCIEFFTIVISRPELLGQHMIGPATVVLAHRVNLSRLYGLFCPIRFDSSLLGRPCSINSTGPLLQKCTWKNVSLGVSIIFETRKIQVSSSVRFRIGKLKDQSCTGAAICNQCTQTQDPRSMWQRFLTGCAYDL